MQHRLELPRPPRSRWPRRHSRADLRQPRHQVAAQTYTYAELTDEVAHARRRPPRSRRQEGRPRHHLHADDPGSADGDARLRPHRRHPFRRLRRLRRRRTRDPHRRLASPLPSSPRLAASKAARIVDYKPLLDRAIELAAHKPSHILMLQRPQCSGHDDRRPRPRLVVARSPTPKPAAARPAAYRSPPPIRSTSSTPRAPPAQPKGVVRDNGGHMVALKWTMKNHYGIEPGEVFWAASDVGWVVGHSYIVYAPLLHGADHRGFRRQARRHARRRHILAHHLRAQGRAHCSPRRPPSAPSRKKTRPASYIKKYDLTGFRTLFLAGERADPETIKWAEAHLKVPVIDHWWQTETGWAICGNPVGLGQLPVKYGSPTVPMPGYDLQVLDSAGHPVARRRHRYARDQAAVAARRLPTLWGNDERFRKSYRLRLPRLLHDIRRRLHRRRRLRLRHGAHRRRHQRRRPPPLDRPDGRSRRQAQGRRLKCAVLGVADEMKGQIPAGVHRAELRRQSSATKRSKPKS